MKTRTKKQIELPKSMEEFNSWTKRKKDALMKQNVDFFTGKEYTIEDLKEDIRINNLSTIDFLHEVFDAEDFFEVK